ncbi:MAG: hypothetical protein D6732_11215 [Methanobacteriota archaeon]|nr:MAG: hypothetical protein D6732_11215 [Euryarchaeota archaeon]
MISRIRNLSSINSILSSVWLMLLGLCGIIGAMIVDINITGSYFAIVTAGVLKVAASFLLILIWLAIWIHLMNMTLAHELDKNPEL